MAKTKTFDDALTTRQVMSTNDYSKFKTLEGNRKVNAQHVNQLIKLLVANGNLTDQFPIIISKDGFVIDGQHRLEALKTLGWEVGYIVEESATIETVRNINQGNKNWSWRDVAESYANLGNDEYRWFLDYYDRHEELTYTLAMQFCGAKQSKRSSSSSAFNQGSFTVEDPVRAELFARQYADLRELTDITGHDFGKALNKIFASPYYDHERMIDKLKSYGHQLPIKASQTDYQRELERIFNHGYSEENRVRLF